MQAIEYDPNSGLNLEEIDEIDGCLVKLSKVDYALGDADPLTQYSPITPEILHLFNACDLDNSGFIEEDELHTICSELSPVEIRDVFRELDKDGDGKISVADFAEGFQDISETLLTVTRKHRGRYSAQSSVESTDSQSQDDNEQERIRRRRKKLLEGEKKVSEFLDTIDEGFTNIDKNCQENVCDLYQQLHAAEQPHLLSQFEAIVLSVVRDIRSQQLENDRLERSFKREKEEHAKHMRQMEEDMELQIQRVENRVRKDERERADYDRDEVKLTLELEIKELQNNLSRLQKMNSELNKSPDDETRTRLSKLMDENRGMRSNLTDHQTNLALSKSELSTMRQQFEDKCREINAEKETLVEYIKEQDNLTRQVHLLHDANKKLHDTNDDLRSALDSGRGSLKGPYKKRNIRNGFGDLIASQSQSRETVYGSALSIWTGNTSGNSIADELNSHFDPYNHRLLPTHDSCEIDSIPEDIDSGHSTLRDYHDADSEYDPNSLEDDITPYALRRRPRSGFDSTTESEHHGSQDEDEDGSRPCSSASRSSSLSRSSNGMKNRRLPTIPPVINKVLGEPERMYKIVLAGDAAVGKSSFILRLCKNKFVKNLNSTLGVDFQTKVLEVDGRVIALQLWDTAGQERFRSIAKSYFRRADGVLLLYDCTYERSFTNVREWVYAVEEGAQKKIPIMICANKTDLREEYVDCHKKGIVRTEDGEKLAKDFEALFIETSAKEGNNVEDACVELTRILRTNEDLDIKEAGMRLQDLKHSKSKSPCC